MKFAFRSSCARLCAGALLAGWCTIALAADSQTGQCHQPIPILDGAVPLDLVAPTGPVERWFSYVAEADGLLVVDSIGSAQPASVEIWSGCPGQGGSELNRNYDGAALLPSTHAIVRTADELRIRLRIDGAAAGDVALDVRLEPRDPARLAGPDVIYTDLTFIQNYGQVGGIRGYAYSSNTCNVGSQNLLWRSTGTPGFGMNLYRLANGRLMQIGQSWVKHACCAAAGNGCGMTCNGAGGQVLGAGCLDVYSAGFNGGQTRLGARSGINAHSGAFSTVNPATGNAIFKRLQVAESDMAAANFPGALFFAEGVYVGTDDATAGNWLNNASYKRVTVDASFNLAPTGTMQQRVPAILAWRANGLGAGVADPSVVDGIADIPGEGRFHYAYKVTDLGNGSYRYDYAIFNLNSHVSAGSLRVPVPTAFPKRNIGFHAPLYHSGEVYDNTPWSATSQSDELVWASPQTFAENPNSNAIRWGTMYNFWFETDAPPVAGQATLGLFRPHSVSSIQIPVAVPLAPPVVGDISGDRCVNESDLAILLDQWGCAARTCAADLDGDDLVGEPDLAIVLGAWRNGCGE